MNTRPEPGTLNDATKQINEALYSLTELYNYALQALETTPRSKHGKQIKYLVESTGARLHMHRKQQKHRRANPCRGLPIFYDLAKNARS